MNTERKVLTEVCCPGEMFYRDKWHALVLKFYKTNNTKLKYNPFQIWRVIKESRYQIWISEPIIRPGAGWIIGFLRDDVCHSDGMVVYHEIIAAALKTLPGSYVIKQ